MKSEIEFLKIHPLFVNALEAAKDADDWTQLCKMGEDLLKKENRTHPTGHQLRQGTRLYPPAQQSSPA